jgi:hypothetical protein
VRLHFLRVKDLAKTFKVNQRMLSRHIVTPVSNFQDCDGRFVKLIL